MGKYYPGEANIINDDKPAIRYIDNRPLFTELREREDTNKPKHLCPIHAIVFIEKSYDNKITQLKGANAVSLMLVKHKSVYPEMMEITLEHINKVLSRIPVYRLSCNISKDAVELTKKLWAFNFIRMEHLYVKKNYWMYFKRFYDLFFLALKQMLKLNSPI